MPEPETSALDKASEALIRRLYPSLRRFAAVTGPPEVEPNDLVQEALLRTLRTVALADLDHPEAYLRRVILNLSSNHRRSLGRTRRRLASIEVLTPSVRRDDYPSDLDDLFALSPQSRAVLYLAEIEKSPHAEIAMTLGITESHSRKLASKARRKLRADLEEADS